MIKKSSRALVSLMSVAAVLAAPSSAATGPVVDVDTGSVRGSSGAAVESWKGIPFAAPPVGDLRWRAPQPVAAWQGIRDATRYGSDCVQNPVLSDATTSGTAPAEDCLYLNVWRPQLRNPGERLPVVVWIHGGGFVSGGSSAPTYDGANLARQGVVVASFNYRLGRFGTFAHPQLTQENADGGLIGNYGTLDQIAGLEWVKRNIAAFGGDPDNVTVMGESAGGLSVNMLLTSPRTAGLMQRAIIMSGGDGEPLQPVTLGDVEQTGVAWAESEGIAPSDPRALDELRALSAETVRGDLTTKRLFDGRPRNFASPFIDGAIVVDQRAAYDGGAFNRVPVMIGATSADSEPPPMISGAHDIASFIAAHGVPVYLYRFSYVADSGDHTVGARHATDVPFFFHTERIRYGDRTTARDSRVGQTISAYVTNFARSGNPNGPGLPTWPTFDPAEDQIMDFTSRGQAMAERNPLAGTPVSREGG